MRQAGFFASLLLALCVVDARFLEDAREVNAVRALYSLSVQVGAKNTSGSESSFRTEFLSKVNAGVSRPTFIPVGSAQGTLGQRSEYQLEEGTYWAITRAEGFARDARLIQVSSDSSLTIELQPARQLSVRVMVEHGEELVPLEGATVLAGGRGDLPIGGATASDGSVVLQGLPPGPVRVRIFARGYQSYEAETETDLLVRLQPTSTVRVSVFDEGEKVADAEVFVAGVSLWPTRTVMTGHKGSVEISGLKPGRYAMYAKKGSRVSAVRSEVEVIGVRGQTKVELHLGQGRYVSLRVISEERGVEVAGARVTWNSSGLGQFSHHQVTDSEGSALLGPLSESGGMLMVRAPGYVGALVPVESGHGEDDPPQIIELQRSGSVSGRVVDERGFPVPGATVEAVGTDVNGMPIAVSYRSEVIPDAHFDWANDWQRDPSNVLVPVGELGVMLGPVPPIPLAEVNERSGQLLKTNDKGRFTISDIPAGEVLIVARHPEYIDGKSQVLVLTSGSQMETEVVLGSGSSLRGRVLDYRGFPVGGARVQVTARRFDRKVSAESDGTFEIGAAPEKLTLRVSLPESPFRVVLSTEVMGNDRAEEVVVELPEPRKSSVFRVTSRDGDPIELAQVTLISSQPDVPFKQTRFTQSEGTVELPGTHQLRALVVVRAPGFVQRRFQLRVEEENRIQLVSSVHATGRILGVRGRLPASGAEVVFQSGEFVSRGTADELGEYHLRGLPPGEGVLKARHREFGKGSRVVVVKPGVGDREAVLPDLELQPTVEIAGRVEDELGRAVVGAVISAERVSPYLFSGALGDVLGRSDEEGEFRVQVRAEKGLYLYGAQLGRAFGWSDSIAVGDKERVEDVVILLDHKDLARVNERGTLLFGMEERDGELVIFAVAPGSQASRAGVRAEDILKGIDGEVPSDLDDARDLLSGLPGTDVRLTVSRGGELVELLVARELFSR